MAVPNIFGTATAAIPLSQLDQNFATAITLGNTAVYLGNTTTSLGNVTLTNVTISSGTSNIAANVSTAVGLLPEAQGGTGTTTGYYGFKNRIINGAMVIDQRNAGASVTPTNSSYGVDRWQYSLSQASKLTAQQSSTAPAGFTRSNLITSSSAYSVGASEVFLFRQRIEGFNTADFGWGTASAQAVTLSFWVRSSLTGTFGGAIRNDNQDRSYPFSYTINSANTFEQKTVVISGDTTGTWLTNSGTGVEVNFSLGAGSTLSNTAGSWYAGSFASATGATSVVGTNGATFYITGVQLEKGSTATSFDYRPYGTELALCQRYYFKYVASSGSSGFFAGYASLTTLAEGIVSFPVSMRTPPTSLETTGTASNYRVRFLNSAATCSSVPTFFVADIDSSHIRFTVSSGLTAGDGVIGASNAAANVAYLAWSAEL